MSFSKVVKRPPPDLQPNRGLPYYDVVHLVAQCRDHVHEKLHPTDRKPLVDRTPAEIRHWIRAHKSDATLQSIGFSRILPILDKSTFNFAYSSAVVLKPFTAADYSRSPIRFDRRLWDIFNHHKFGNTSLCIDLFRRRRTPSPALPPSPAAIAAATHSPVAPPLSADVGTQYERLFYLICIGKLTRRDAGDDTNSSSACASTSSKALRKRSCPSFRVTLNHANRVANAVTVIIRAWDVLARIFGFASIDHLVAPYILFNITTGDFHPLNSDEGYAPFLQARVFDKASTTATHDLDATYPTIRDFNDATHAILREVAASFLSDLRKYVLDDSLFDTDGVHWIGLSFLQPSTETVLSEAFDHRSDLLFRLHKTLARGVYVHYVSSSTFTPHENEDLPSDSISPPDNFSPTEEDSCEIQPVPNVASNQSSLRTDGRKKHVGSSKIKRTCHEENDVPSTEVKNDINSSEPAAPSCSRRQKNEENAVHSTQVRNDINSSELVLPSGSCRQKDVRSDLKWNRGAATKGTRRGRDSSRNTEEGSPSSEPLDRRKDTAHHGGSNEHQSVAKGGSKVMDKVAARKNIIQGGSPQNQVDSSQTGTETLRKTRGARERRTQTVEEELSDDVGVVVAEASSPESPNDISPSCALADGEVGVHGDAPGAKSDASPLSTVEQTSVDRPENAVSAELSKKSLPRNPVLVTKVLSHRIQKKDGPPLEPRVNTMERGQHTSTEHEKETVLIPAANRKVEVMRSKDRRGGLASGKLRPSRSVREGNPSMTDRRESDNSAELPEKNISRITAKSNAWKDDSDPGGKALGLSPSRGRSNDRPIVNRKPPVSPSSDECVPLDIAAGERSPRAEKEKMPSRSTFKSSILKYGALSAGEARSPSDSGRRLGTEARDGRRSEEFRDVHVTSRSMSKTTIEKDTIIAGGKLSLFRRNSGPQASMERGESDDVVERCKEASPSGIGTTYRDAGLDYGSGRNIAMKTSRHVPKGCAEDDLYQQPKETPQQVSKIRVTEKSKDAHGIHGSDRKLQMIPPAKVHGVPKDRRDMKKVLGLPENERPTRSGGEPLRVEEARIVDGTPQGSSSGHPYRRCRDRQENEALRGQTNRMVRGMAERDYNNNDSGDNSQLIPSKTVQHASKRHVKEGEGSSEPPSDDVPSRSAVKPTMAKETAVSSGKRNIFSERSGPQVAMVRRERQAKESRASKEGDGSNPMQVDTIEGEEDEVVANTGKERDGTGTKYGRKRSFVAEPDKNGADESNDTDRRERKRRNMGKGHGRHDGRRVMVEEDGPEVSEERGKNRKERSGDGAGGEKETRWLLPPMSIPPPHILKFVGALWGMPRLDEELRNKPTHFWPTNVMRQLSVVDRSTLLATECVSCELYVDKSRMCDRAEGVFAGRQFSSGDVICDFYGVLAYESDGGGVTLSKGGTELLGKAMQRVGVGLPRIVAKWQMRCGGPVRRAFVVPFEGCVTSKMFSRTIADDTMAGDGAPAGAFNARCVRRRSVAGIRRMSELCETDAVTVVASRGIESGEEICLVLNDGVGVQKVQSHQRRQSRSNISASSARPTVVRR